jgi:DNA-binding transcriptional ArsR family regulator
VSIRVMNWVWEHSAAKGTERLLLLAIADAADDTGRNAFPSVDTLARKIVMSPRTVQRLVAKLEAGGLIEVERQLGGRDSNRYRIVMPEPQIGAGTVATRDPHEPHESSAESTGGDKLSPRQIDTPDIATSPLRRHSYDTPGVTQLCHPTPPLTVLYPSTPGSTVDDPTRYEPGGGGGQDALTGRDDVPRARPVLDQLGSQWRLGARSIERLAGPVAAALDAGWDPSELATYLSANSDGVKSPYAVLAARLADLPAPPAPRAARPPWCGDCHESTRLVDTDTDARRCPACHPAVAHSNRLRRSS